MSIPFADPKDPNLRKLENSFLLGPILVYARFSSIPSQIDYRVIVECIHMCLYGSVSCSFCYLDYYS